MTSRFLLAAFLAVLSVGAIAANGQATKAPSLPSGLDLMGVQESQTIKPGDLFKETKLVSYDYDANRTYPVRARVKVLTEIQVPDGEKITGYYPSADAARGWPYSVSGDKQRVFVMPNEDGTANTATLVTDKRSYLLAFESSASGVWFQRVRWNVPSSTNPLASRFEDDGMQDGGSYAGGGMPSIEKLRFGYSVDGEAKFRPVTIFDDGASTWFRVPNPSQELPALFLLDGKDRPELVNYTIENGMIKARRVSDAWLLKLGEEEVKVFANGRKPATSGLFGWFSK